MADYIAVFVPGLERIARDLPRILRGAKVLSVQSGFVRFAYGGDPRAAARVPLFNNTFYVIRRFTAVKGGFAEMTGAAVRQKNRYLPVKGTFRVRFSRENRFEKAPGDGLLLAEREVRRATGMAVNRVNPDNEIWYMLRAGGDGYYCQLLPKPAERPAKGELRPELAWALCHIARIRPGYVVCDPFAGHGAIAEQALRLTPRGVVVAIDRDPALAAKLSARFSKFGDRARAIKADILAPGFILPQKADVIVTDPPWGDYASIGDAELFYAKMLRVFCRIAKPGATAVVLTARKDYLEAAAGSCGIEVLLRDDALVNGKKAAIFALRLPQDGAL